MNDTEEFAPPAKRRRAILFHAVDARRTVEIEETRTRFGDRLRIAVSGAAPLGEELAEFYEVIGMPIAEGYGLTEGGILILNPLDRPKPGSIGKPLPGVEVRIAADGELLARAPCLFSGYFNDPQTTSELLRDGWLYTGDVAEMDAEGYIYITGRKKEVIIASNGKKIYPVRIENLFKLEPIVTHVVPVGDGETCVAALLTVNVSVAEGKSAVARVNAQLAPFEQIRRYRVLENYRTVIEALYSGLESQAGRNPQISSPDN